jgi:hypothetical protein
MYRLYIPAHIPNPSLPIRIVGVVSIIFMRLKMIEITFDHKKALFVSPSKRELAILIAML